jgi:tetratricopeptide (TPR) repeat protein
VHYVSRDYQSALRAARHVLDMDPDFPPAHQLIGAAALALDRRSDALFHFERAVELQHRHPVPLAWLAHGLASIWRIQESHAVLRELTTIARHRYVSPYGVALVYTALGRCDEALDALQAASAGRACEFVNLAVEPRFDPLRNTPVFRRLLRRLGLADLEDAV